MLQQFNESCNCLANVWRFREELRNYKLTRLLLSLPFLDSILAQTTWNVIAIAIAIGIAIFGHLYALLIAILIRRKLCLMEWSTYRRWFGRIGLNFDLICTRLYAVGVWWTSTVTTSAAARSIISVGIGHFRPIIGRRLRSLVTGRCHHSRHWIWWRSCRLRGFVAGRWYHSGHWIWRRSCRLGGLNTEEKSVVWGAKFKLYHVCCKAWGLEAEYEFEEGDGGEGPGLGNESPINGGSWRRYLWDHIIIIIICS